MRRTLTAALITLEAAAACALARCAAISHAHGSDAYTVLFCAAAIVLGLAITFQAVMRDDLHAALALVEQAARPADRTEDLIRAEIAEAHRQLAALCCWLSFETAGAEHDPDTCTRKDQTT